MADVRLVDGHVHVVSDDEVAYPLDPSTSMRAVTGEWYRTHPVSVERLLAEMDEAGVDRAVLVQAVSAYQWDNRYAADSARRFPSRLSSVAAIATAGEDPAGAARAAVARDGMRGIRWFVVHGQHALDEPRSVWDAAHDLGVPVVMTILADRLEELAHTLAVVPPVQVALDHCAFADFSKGVPDDLAELARFSNLSLKVSTITLDLMAEHGDVADGVVELASVFGAHRMMWGSDYSQTHDRTYQELTAYARAAGAKLTDDQRIQVLGRNALSLWW